MNQNQSASAALPHIFRTLAAHPKRWLLPTFVITALAVIFALCYQPAWEATQALTVRNKAALSEDRYRQPDEMQSLRNIQETILELAKSPAAVTAALRQIDNLTEGGNTSQWPTTEDVETTQNHIQLKPPKGAEYGTTELFYLKVTDPDRQRALALADAICDQMILHFQELRNRKTQSVIDELTKTVHLSQKELEQATQQLAAMETSIGSDLAELRSLDQPSGGNGSLQTTLVSVRQETRQARNALQSDSQLLELLTAAQKDPVHLVATPNRLLQSQPALRRLKDGLIDAQLNTSRLLGTMSSEHPRVQAAQVAEQEIRGHLHRELSIAIRGLQTETSANQHRIDTLTEQLDQLQRRMQHLASIRAAYSNLAVEVRKRSENLTRAQQDLTNARATQAASLSTSLIARVDHVQTGSKPKGPGKAMIIAFGLIGGLLIGWGIVFLTTAPLIDNAVPVAECPPAEQPIANPLKQPVARSIPGLSLQKALAQCADRAGQPN